jgi:hypothetical protein
LDAQRWWRRWWKGRIGILWQFGQGRFEFWEFELGQFVIWVRYIQRGCSSERESGSGRTHGECKRGESEAEKAKYPFASQRQKRRRLGTDERG